MRIPMSGPKSWQNRGMSDYTAVVVGAGPNGLAAAVELTRSGRRVLVVEGSDVIGGGTRTEALTSAEFLHDVCSAIHPLGAASPFFRSIDVGDWIQPDIPLTHPIDGGRVGILHRSIDETARGLDTDERRYRRFVSGLVDQADDVLAQILGPLPVAPSHPITLARFGLPGLLPASVTARSFKTDEARALYGGLAAHAIAPFSAVMTGAIAEIFAMTAHAYGWPLVRGGSQRLAEQLVGIVVDGGGSIETGRMVTSLSEIPQAPIVLLDVMPDAAERIVGDRLDRTARKRLRRWRSGPGVFKVDWALDGPIPWSDGASARAGTVHVGGTYEEVASAEMAVHAGDHPDHPFVFVAQQSLFDPSRAPHGKQTAWGYCHVPARSDRDMTTAIEAQIERFAPGFRDLILARHTMDTAAYERHNPNLVGGDIAGGAFSARRLLQFGNSRPYRIGDGLYLCSSATPPGGGVHGMCGYHAARAAISDSE
ncbi:MAG: NAD(P)/FAD-dependent oxidoreductase [Actinomycetota bacterium]|nr:NAD(P)/FAD-dependent oxidoreductase [Actinomycetota bacterium]